MQGSPAESEKKSETTWVKTVVRVVLEMAFIIAIFYAGYVYGDFIISNSCPPLDLVESCYACAGSVIPIDIVTNITEVLG